MTARSDGAGSKAGRRAKRLLSSAGDRVLRFLSAIGEHALLVGLAVVAATLVAVFFLGLSLLSPSSPGLETSLSNINTLIDQDRVVSSLLRDQDARIEVLTTLGKRLWASYPHSDSYTTRLLDRLSNHNVPATIDPQSGKPTLRAVVQFLLPILILATIFALLTMLTREAAGGGFAAFSRWSGRGQKAGTGMITFKDVAGAPEALIELREIRDYLEDPAKYARVGARAPKGVLLVGPPGTGKTLLARAVAGEAKANFFSISGSEFVESLVGVGAARVRDLFRKARKAAPAIIFIDELDAVGRQRGAGMGQGHDEREQTLNQMLVELDGFSTESGIVVMAATNRPDILDGALLRPGRFDRQVVVDLPDVYGRTEILELHASGAPIAPQADLSRIAHQTPGFSGADLANLINEASLMAVRADKTEIGQVELEEAIDRVLMGPARKSHLLSQDELWRIAVHESGHAVVALAVGNRASLQKLSVVARGRGRGGATIYSSSDKLTLSELDLVRDLVTLMSGAAAEELVFGMLSTGVDADLDQATKTAHSMVAFYGMSPEVGPVAIGEKQGEVFIGRDLAHMANVAAATLELVDREVRRMVQEADATARRVIEANADILQQLANALLQAETLSGPALDVILAGVRPWPEPLVKEKHKSVTIEFRPAEVGADTDELWR